MKTFIFPILLFSFTAANIIFFSFLEMKYAVKLGTELHISKYKQVYTTRPASTLQRNQHIIHIPTKPLQVADQPQTGASSRIVGNKSQFSDIESRHLEIGSNRSHGTGTVSSPTKKTQISHKKYTKSKLHVHTQAANPLYSKHVINPYIVKFINSSKGCGIKHQPDGNVFLLVLIACRASETRDRILIRQTWGNVSNHQGKAIMVRFLLGLTKGPTEKMIIEKEIIEHGDIVQGDFIDSYRNMTHKVLMGLNWAAQMCSNATYVMNSDCDMFVNVFNLVTLLNNAPRQNYAIGRLRYHSRPFRGRVSKWYTPVEMYPKSTYPPYLNGAAYVMSADLPGRIVNESPHVRYIPWDDVFIGLVMKKLGVKQIRGSHFEDHCNLRDISSIRKAIATGIAVDVGHQYNSNPIVIEIWRNISLSIIR